MRSESQDAGGEITNRKETALQTFGEGFNCCQAILSAFSDEYTLDKATALKIAAGFGAGMRKGEVCGAVSGAVMVLGLKYGHSKKGAILTKKKMNDKTVSFTEKFVKKNGSIVCRTILGFDLSRKKEYREAEKKGLFSTVCPKAISDAVEILEESL